MPAFNAARFVGEAARSILGQTLRELELVVVDDGSTDETTAVVSALGDSRVRLVRHPENRGLVAALNRGLDEVTADLIAIHHADDIALPDRLATQVPLFAEDPKLVLAGSSYELIDEAGSTIGLKARSEGDAAIRWGSLFMIPFGHPTIVFRGDVARRHGVRYRADYFPAEDYKLVSELLRLGRARNIRRPLVRYRVHDAQVTSTTWERQNAVADRIARENLLALGVDVAEDEVAALRALYFEPPRRLDRRSLPAARKLYDAAAALAGSGDVDGDAADEILSSVLDKLAVAYAGAGVRGAASFAPLALRHRRWTLRRVRGKR